LYSRRVGGIFNCIRLSDHDAALREILQETYESILNASDTYEQSGDLIILGGSKPVSPSGDSKGWWGAIVCIVGLIITGGVFIKNMYHPVNTIAALTIMKKTTTERAEYKYILLPDSTQVWLNAGSTLEYPENFDKTVREITLLGEAYFDVKHAAEHPFIIHTGKVITTVMGTAFNINAYADRTNIKVSVSRGKVKVSLGNQVLATLYKDQEIKVSKSENQTQQKVLSTNTVAAWQQGNMVYEDETLGEIIADLERVYNVNIKISAGRMSSLQVTTRFRRDLRTGHALEILRKLTDTHSEQKNGTI
jgi:ferric-dicitrate binding protein FerR (iron transport regulator)